jgi:hypothetical protein
MTAHLRHPYSNLFAIGYLRDGTPVWPVIGGADDPPADPPAEPPADSSPPVDAPKPKDDDGLGDAGKKALAAERKRANDAEKELAKFRKAEQDKADADKSETEKRAAAEKRAEEAELRVLRLEVAQDKGLTAAQAKRLVGATREELEADADDLVATFGAKQGDGKTTPKPDPSQGARGAGPTVDSRIAEAQAKGDWRTVISLQNEKLAKSV